jgi:mono/diheme cytochrome c family protein
MKRITYITAILLSAIIVISSCDDKRKPGKIYMPDMTYSRAYESYSLHDSTKFTLDASKKGGSLIYYDSKPVAGTINKGELFPYTLPNDSNGYKMSATIKNPLADSAISKADMAEAGRLYNINCAICHGEKAIANGPLATSGKIGGIANLTLPNFVAMADGTMFHSIMYGKNNMGSYASQLSSKQRWMIIKYIRTLQPKASVAAATTASKAAVTDSTSIKKGK